MGVIRNTLSRGTIRSVAGPFLLLLLFEAASAQVAQFEVSAERDTAYLDYSTEVSTQDLGGCERVPCLRSLQTAREGVSGGKRAFQVRAHNACLREDRPAHLSWADFPDENLLGETPVPRLQITDIEVGLDTVSNTPEVYCAGFWQDTAYLVRWSAKNGSLDRLVAGIGGDKDSSGDWQPEVRLAGACDYDFDGQSEMFFYLNTVRDRTPRTLLCVEREPFRIAWSLSVASPVIAVFSCHDSVNPGVILSTHPAGQGAVDSQFTDSWGYLIRVDTTGNTVFTRVISRYPIGSTIRESSTRGEFYLGHTLPICSDTMSILDSVPGSILSRIDANGNVLAQNRDFTPAFDLWTDSWGEPEDEQVYVRMRSGVIRVLDRALSLRAESDSCDITGYVAWIPRFDGNAPAVALHERSGAVGIYTRHLEKLAELPNIDFLEVLQRGPDGEVTALAMSRNAGPHSYVRLQRQGILKRISTFYRSHQVYVLSVLFAALAAFAVSNFYRRRTKQNLSIIRRQKQELEETHRALKDAQQTIIAQEKYRQAKDIAGGFAHEIRNALFPADGAMVRLRRMLDHETIDRTKTGKMLEAVDDAVARAVGITEQISLYTKMDSLYAPEAVTIAESAAEVVRALKTRLESDQIAVKLSGEATSVVTSNRRQLFSILNNLVVNSIDALAGRRNPTIEISWTERGEEVELVVEDNGEGIPTENLSRIFETFYSTKPSTGTGLGLAIVKRAVEMYGGSIRVDSVLGQQTSFTIRFKNADIQRITPQQEPAADSALETP